MNRRATLKQSELKRYAKALRSAEITDWRVVVRPDGTHEIIVGKESDGGAVNNDWD